VASLCAESGASPPTRLVALPYLSQRPAQHSYGCAAGWWHAAAPTSAEAVPFERREYITYIGSGHYSNALAVTWLLEQVLPAWAFLQHFKRRHQGRLPGLDECPADFGNSTVPASEQGRGPRLMLTGAPKWKVVLEAARKRMPRWKWLLRRVQVPEGGFVGDLDATLGRTRILWAPSLLQGSGVSTKVMKGLENGIPVALNAAAAAGYGCPDTSVRRLRCPHLLVTGPETQLLRQKLDRRAEAYWLARATMGLHTMKSRWEALAKAGLWFAQQQRSPSSWDGPLDALMTS
jgi:hypothetical protein